MFGIGGNLRRRLASRTQRKVEAAAQRRHKMPDTAGTTARQIMERAEFTAYHEPALEPPALQDVACILKRLPFTINHSRP